LDSDLPKEWALNESLQAERVRTIEISVNTKPVTLTKDHGEAEATGAQIKAEAIAQGVNIRADFPLFLKHGSELEAIRDDQVVTVHQHDKFVAVAPDDNS
jgi:hypothetical protein